MKAVSAQAVSCCVHVNPSKIMLHMHDIIPYIFDCWADPVFHLILLKSSIDTVSFGAASDICQRLLWLEKTVTMAMPIGAKTYIE